MGEDGNTLEINTALIPWCFLSQIIEAEDFTELYPQLI
jgi:hypothetical protein